MIHRQIFCNQIGGRATNWLLVVALLTAVLVVAACTTPVQTPTQYVFDDLGRLVAFNGTPQRIISLAPSNTEILFALDLGDKVVGVTSWCDYPPAAVGKEQVGEYDTPDMEKITAVNPDLILVSYGTSMEVINGMVGLGLTVFGIESTDLDDVLNDIRTIGEITDKEIEAQALTSEMESRIQAVTDQTAALEQRPKVFFLFDTYGGLWTVGQGTFIHELIEEAGGVNICQNLTGYTTIALEEVIARNPEIIIAGEWAYDWAIDATELASTNASQTDRIFACDDDIVQRPGPRLVDGLEWFVYFIHPETFDEPDD